MENVIQEATRKPLRTASTLLPIHLSETWRRAVDSGLVVAVAFVDFKKAFDSVYHTVLETKLERDFGIRGPLFRLVKELS